MPRITPLTSSARALEPKERHEQADIDSDQQDRQIERHRRGHKEQQHGQRCKGSDQAANNPQHDRQDLASDGGSTNA